MRCFLFCLLLLCSAAGTAQKADFAVAVDNYANSPVVLGYYYNKQMLVKDTVMTDGRGVARFAGTANYPEGVYVIYIPDKSYFDIILTDDQTFNITCDTTQNMLRNAKVTGCEALADFVDYQHFLMLKQQYYKALSEQMKQSEGDQAAIDRLREQARQTDTEVKQELERLMSKHSDNFFSVFLRGVKDIQIPDFDVPEATANRDSVLQAKRYYYYRSHFFDNFDLTDERLLRTQFFAAKVDKYFNDVVPQIPDTVAAEAIALIEKTRPNKEMFKYMVSHLYNMVNESKIMGMDGALVAIAERYYLSGEAFWADDKFVSDLRETIPKIKYTLIGRNAVDLKLVSPAGEWYRLSEVDARFTILVFWEPSCGHCQKEIPKLKTEVWDKYKDKGVKIFAVYCQNEMKEWTEFIEKHNLEEWINVYDANHRSGFRTYYNINSTPQIFILDSHKDIIAKKISAEQIGPFLDFMIENEQRK